MPMLVSLTLAAALALQPPGRFHGEEALARDGERWLALTVRGDGRVALVAIRVQVRAVHDAVLDAEGEASGREVLATDAPGALMLFRGEGLRPGPVVGARIAADADTLSRVEPLTLGHAHYRFGLECAPARPDGTRACAFVLQREGVSQRVLEFAAYTQDGTTVLGNEGGARLLFAGDLDRDGRLDLLLDASDHYNVSQPTLLLSSQARAGQLAGEAATHRSVGC